MIARIAATVAAPRREPFVEALRLLGSSPHATLHVGDSLGSDLAGAAGSGQPFAWVNPGARSLRPGARAAQVVRNVGALRVRAEE